jgi:hypothetical protein
MTSSVLTFSTKDTYFNPPRCECVILLNISYHTSSSVLTFSTKEIYFDPSRCECVILLNILYHSSSSDLTFSTKDKILIRPAACVI